MAKKAPQPESASREPHDLERLDRTVKELVGQVRTLSLIMDEIRDELIYAVRNDRFNAIPESTWRPAQTPPALSHPPKSPAPAAVPTPEKNAPVPDLSSRRASSLFE